MLFDNFGEFEKSLDNWVKETDLLFKDILKRLAFEIQDRVIDRTPVDSGAARASWNLTVRTPNTEVQEPPKRKKRGRKAALEAARSLRKGLPDFDPYNDTIWLTNATPYILHLEHGSSKQAPVGMVAVTIAEVEAGLIIRLL